MTPSICLIQQFSLELQGKLLFDELNFQLPSQQFCALIGANGQGKSILLNALHDLKQLQEHNPITTHGQISWSSQHAHLAQLNRLSEEHQSIADALDITELANCFNRIEQGIAQDQDYEKVDALWHLPQQWHHMLQQAKLPTDLTFKIELLSEGQKTKLALCRLFQLKDHYLLLDEPSNHLDQQSRQWLVEQIQQHPAGCLVASHDRELLNQADQLYVLNSFGIQQYTCSYQQYQTQHSLELQALQRKVQQDKRDIKQLKQQQHETRMKAEKRQHHANKARQNTSQAKVLLDYQKDQAQQSRSHLHRQLDRQMHGAEQRLTQTQQQLEVIKPQRFALGYNPPRIQHGEILRCTQVQLQHVQTQAIHFALSATEKMRLCAANGMGKSSLLQLIHQRQAPKQGEIYVAGKTLYLDQNFSFLDPKLNAVDNLMQLSDEIFAVDWRRLLGQLGLKREKTLDPIAQLSGGEQLKVALTAMSQLSDRIDLLILDEPENHLDIESRQLLAHAIAAFPGAVILVSHDDTFVKDCAIELRYDIVA